MRAPRYPPDRIIMSRQNRQRPLSRRPDIERPDQLIHPRRRHGARPVFVPVVRKGFVGGEGAGCAAERCGYLRGLLRGVDWDCEDEVVGGGGRGAEVEEAEVAVARDGGEEGGRVRGEAGGVGAGVGGECEEGGGARGVPLPYGQRDGLPLGLDGAHYHFDSAVPGAGTECVFSD